MRILHLIIDSIALVGIFAMPLAVLYLSTL